MDFAATNYNAASTEAPISSSTTNWDRYANEGDSAADTAANSTSARAHAAVPTFKYAETTGPDVWVAETTRPMYANRSDNVCHYGGYF